jgi:hypothetical protein
MVGAAAHRLQRTPAPPLASAPACQKRFVVGSSLASLAAAGQVVQHHPVPFPVREGQHEAVARASSAPRSQVATRPRPALTATFAGPMPGPQAGLLTPGAGGGILLSGRADLRSIRRSGVSDDTACSMVVWRDWCNRTGG